MPVTRKANTAKKRRQWKHIEDSEVRSGRTRGEAARIANGVIKRGGKRAPKR